MATMNREFQTQAGGVGNSQVSSFIWFVDKLGLSFRAAFTSSGDVVLSDLSLANLMARCNAYSAAHAHDRDYENSSPEGPVGQHYTWAYTQFYLHESVGA